MCDDDLLRDAYELRSAYGFLLMRLAVAKDLDDVFEVCKREFMDHEPVLKRLEKIPAVLRGRPNGDVR
jgi:hypothetical protein